MYIIVYFVQGLPAAEHLGDVTLTNIDNNENVNKQFLESMPNDNSALMSGVMKKPAPGKLVICQSGSVSCGNDWLLIS